VQPLRDYQARAVGQVRERWAANVRRVLLVSPTGSGKTRMGEELAVPFQHVVWLAHRKELIRDASERLRAALGPLEVGVIIPGVAPSPYSRIQVTSVQTMLARGVRPPADLVVFDEAHHMAADDWSKIAESYRDALHLLLTAPPERQDGKAMGDIADEMIVAAEYSELLAAGHLVPIRAYRPEQILGGNLAQDPVDAWVRYSDGGCGFAFHPTRDIAHAVTARMVERGIRAATIEQGTKPVERQAIIEGMRAGEVDCINNVYTMTEGVDVPRARVCMLASAAHHCGGYLQKAGRVLRPHPSKTNAILIDLVGASILHGPPTENRIYSLDGKPIERTSVQPLRSCLSCGAVVHAAYQKCPECGYVFPAEKRKGPKIYSLELVEVFAGSNTPEDAKRREYHRLRILQRERGWDLYFVQKEFKKLFGSDCVINDATSDEKREEYAKLRALASSRGFKPGFAKVRFKNLFGCWPNG
jgi:DNA repair protein RadD